MRLRRDRSGSRTVRRRLALLLVVLMTAPAPAAAQIVRAVLFHSPTCPHCLQVVNEDLPIFFEVYGGPPQVTRRAPHLALATNGRLAILFIDVSYPEGGALYEASLLSHPVAPDRRGVPRLLIGEAVLVGSQEIPARLHGRIRDALANGGLSWPAVPGLAEVAEEPAPDPPSVPPAGADTSRSPEPASAAREPVSLAELGTAAPATAGERVRRDPVGNGLAVAALAAMVLVTGAVATGVPARIGPRAPGFWVPLLALLGAGVAAYLTYVETTGSTAICGPVGDCNTVQQSPYARLFGVIPIGVLGIAGYGAILVLWVLGQPGRPTARLARRALVAVAMVGTAFSIYLTALEPFVIGATCLWCLSSAVTMTALLWLAAAWRTPADGHQHRGS